MPAFDLRGIKVAKYVNNNGTVSYTNRQTAGDAMTAALELRYAEGRLYAESTLAEYMRKAVGGTITLGVKYIPDAAQKLMFGSVEKTRSITYQVGTTEVTESVSSLQLGAESQSTYVGVAFYAPDKVDSADKFTAVFIPKALFGPPSNNYQTAGDSINFQSQTTTGEFLASDSADKTLFEYVVLDSEAAAKAWVDAVLATA